MVRMGRMMVIPSWAPDAAGVLLRRASQRQVHNFDRRSEAGGGGWGWRLPAPSRQPLIGGCYGMYCSAILTTWPWRTVIQNGMPSGAA